MTIIRIATYNGFSEISVPDNRVVGRFAIHPFLLGDDLIEDPSSYVITHLPTGKRIPRMLPSVADARKLSRELDKLPFVHKKRLSAQNLATMKSTCDTLMPDLVRQP